MSTQLSERISKDTVLGNAKQLSDFLEKSGKSAIQLALPKHLNADRLLRVVLTCFNTTPKLRECTAHSILASTVLAAQVGLEPGIQGQGYLVPYGKTCTFVPGWQGLVGLLNNTGRATAWTGAVYEGDDFEFELGSNPKCRHVPGENFGDPDYLTWVYACGKVNGSEQPIVEAWPIKRVLKHRDRHNKVGKAHYSFGNFEMYARKVVLLQVLKYLPRSIHVDNAITAVNAHEEGRIAKVEDGVVVDVSASEVTAADDLEKAATTAAPKRNQTRGKSTPPPPPAPEPEKQEAEVVHPDPSPEPEPALDPPPSSAGERVQVGQALLAELKEAGVSELEFEKACRAAGLITETGTVRGSSLEKLKLIKEAASQVIEVIKSSK